MDYSSRLLHFVGQFAYSRYDIHVFVLTGYLTNTIAYTSHLNLDRVLISMELEELEQLMDPCNVTSQLLLAHIIAVHLVMRPIACHERKTYTVTMYSIRMTSWIDQIHNELQPEFKEAVDWPLLISQLHKAKRLEEYTLVSKPQITSVAQVP